MGEEKKVVRKKIEATGIMNKYMADYFYELGVKLSSYHKLRLIYCQKNI